MPTTRPPTRLMAVMSRPGDGVAAHELRRAVHGAEEARFVLQRLAALLGLLLVDQAGREVGVDRHLLAGHRIEREARRDLRDAPRALGDDDEVHDHEDREDDQPDDEVAAHHEAAEGLDDLAGGVGAGVALGQDEPRRGEVERQAHHGRDEEDRREGRELQGRADEQRGHHHEHREGDRDGEEEVEHDRRHRQDQHDQDEHDREGEAEIAALQEAGAEPVPHRGPCAR